MRIFRVSLRGSFLIAEHIIQVYNKAQLLMKKVNIKTWTSYFNGAAIFAGYKEVQINLNDWIFSSNFAIFGGRISLNYSYFRIKFL